MPNSQTYNYLFLLNIFNNAKGVTASIFSIREESEQAVSIGTNVESQDMLEGEEGFEQE